MVKPPLLTDVAAVEKALRACTLFNEAIAGGRLDVRRAAALVSGQGATMRYYESMLYSLMHAADQAAGLKVASVLLKWGVCPEPLWKTKGSLLHSAFVTGKVQWQDLLLQYGANPYRVLVTCTEDAALLWSTVGTACGQWVRWRPRHARRAWCLAVTLIKTVF